jgi:AcrR family transcriptional regulator
MGRRAGLNVEHTREKLLEAAKSVFIQDGFDGAKVSKIAKEAGLTTGAIYSQYSTKSELLVETIKKNASSELSKLLDELPGDTLIDFLKLAGNQLPYRDRQTGVLLLQAFQAATLDETVYIHLRDHILDREQLLRNALEKAKENGQLRDLDEDALCRFMVMLSLGSLLTKVLDLPDPKQTEWNELLNLIIAVLGNDGGQK